jgi:1-aminocyclopropane-1-carboxylate deaminase
VEALDHALRNISLDHWVHHHFRKHDLKVEVLRLDKIHPEISGNKWFKLKYYLQKARQQDIQQLVSFGGAYSNHLLALAAGARMAGFASLGLIRGEEPTNWSPMLISARKSGMDIRFLSRALYDRYKHGDLPMDLEGVQENALLIPEGGGGPEGVRGAEEILSTVDIHPYTHFICAVGTGTTLAGIINSTGSHQKKIGVSVLKGTTGWEPLNQDWVKNPTKLDNVQMIHEDHFGGYAKYSKVLLDFMNELYKTSGIPTDFVYTAKLFYSVVRMAEMKSFLPGSRLLVLHTGGLSGNDSLRPELLEF